ncbi:MAG: hypothetical protein PUE85_06725 [Firmicutes bacterium]|nr:hypothetical protein [Bacillota bacterium]
MKALKKIVIVLLATAAILTAVFLAGRYGWKLGGFRACQSAGISSVEVNEQSVYITGFCPGLFPKGFCGYYAEEKDGKLYVGFRFSAVFGFFETGDFIVTIPVKGKISEVVVKTKMNEYSIWNAQTGPSFPSERYGVYVKQESKDEYSVTMSYTGLSGEASSTDCTAMDSGEYCFMDNDIMIASKEANAPVPFTITVKDADGNVTASKVFSFDAGMEKMYLTVTADGRIVKDSKDE